MRTLHLEFQGKSTRVGLYTLPVQKPKSAIMRRTTAGELRTHRLINGINKDTNHGAITFDALVQADPELNLDLAGVAIDADSVSTAYFDPSDAKRTPIGDFKDIDIVMDANGQEKSRRPHLKRSCNLDELHPVKIGKRMPIAEALGSVVLKQTMQLAHVDGLTYDFLREIARDLAAKQEVAVLGAGAKGNLPLVLRESGTAYRAFLLGEVDDQGRYKLLLLLSDQELKRPESNTEDAT
jgi:hypothetical protein